MNYRVGRLSDYALSCVRKRMSVVVVAKRGLASHSHFCSLRLQAKQLFDEAALAVEKQLVKVSRSGLTYFAEYKYGRLEHKMDHLACFAGNVQMLARQLHWGSLSTYMPVQRYWLNTFSSGSTNLPSYSVISIV